MDIQIQQSIETRRGALYDYYELPSKAKQTAEEVFLKMEQLGSECKDQADFEKRLLDSPINAEYNKLFADFTRYVKRPEGTPTKGEFMRDYASSTARSMVEHRAKVGLRARIFRMMPESIQNWMVRGAYNIPILGDILSARNQVDMARRFTGGFKDEETNDTNPEEKNTKLKKDKSEKK
ncbi:MAG: hypothetical protein GX102_02225 [Porphyromonadaceae bacterium]|jgi:hypothetical protein|nr:hypothetical protein [Porphyromonadaceae bacterium]